MHVRLLFALLSLLWLAAPAQAETPCSDCFYAAEEQTRKCLDNAISSGDKNDCLENRRVRLKACSEIQCRGDREEMATTEVQPIPSRPGLAPYSPTEGEWLALVMRAGIEAKSGGTIQRAGQVNVYGLDERAWSFMETGGIDLPKGTNVVLNSRTADAIGAKVGDEVTLWIELPSAVPRDTLLGKKDSDSQEIVLTVGSIAPEQIGLAKLGLQPTQALPLNAFVDLHVLRVVPRLGISQAKDATRMEKDLMAALPKPLWHHVGMCISFLGRETCRPTNPKCSECVMQAYCAYASSRNK